jgi:hypothetical protein
MNLDEPPFAKKPAPGASNQQVQTDTDSVQEVDLNPDEQVIYDKLMKAAYGIMGDEKSFPELEKMIELDPHKAIVDATLTIIERIEQDHGVQDPEILLVMAEEIVPALADLALEKGTDIPEEELEQVITIAIAQWMKANPDRVDQEGMTQVGNAATQAIQGAAPAVAPAPVQGA